MKVEWLRRQAEMKARWQTADRLRADAESAAAAAEAAWASNEAALADAQRDLATLERDGKEYRRTHAGTE